MYETKSDRKELVSYMKTTHKIINCDSKNTERYIKDNSVALVVTSPPYPMIEMWDECFSAQNEKVRIALEEKKYEDAFEEMHQVLDKTWEDVNRVLIDGGIVCINIGDATKNCDGRFKLFSNHARIINKFLSMGYDVLPDIHWHKPTNAPNKFMGSGMYPSCAYVTYEHEYILIFRKGENRKFGNKEKENRHNSAYFWEERNIWFSDLWELTGTTQKLKNKASRTRSAAYPFELAYRLINMYSLKGDVVYDPFIGTGTTVKASMLSERCSIGTDIDTDLCLHGMESSVKEVPMLNNYLNERISRHNNFIDSQPEEKKSKLYQNTNHSFKVKTKQETEILLSLIEKAEILSGEIICEYKKADA